MKKQGNLINCGKEEFFSFINQFDMHIRKALSSDIPRIQVVRNLVKENQLSDPSLVTNEDCEDFINRRGKGWVAEIENEVVGFAIVDLQENNVWALFIEPSYEKGGIGKALQKEMLDWYFNQTDETLWLGTAPGTRAETFYRRTGWTECGVHGKGEIKFEMKKDSWLSLNNAL